MYDYYYPQNMGQQPQQRQQGANNNIIWVQGISGAKAYPVAPGAAVWMMDSEEKRFYLKSADGSGLPNPLRIFEYAEIQEKRNEPEASPEKYITREEFEKWLAALIGGKENE